MSTDAKRRIFSAAFLALLSLSVVWPDPVVDINRLCCDARLGIDELSFLGREAPSWDVAYWCIVGLFTLALLLQPGADFRSIAVQVRNIALRRSMLIVSFAIAAGLVAIIWMWADEPLMQASEMIASPRIADAIRIANRFGGGMNPVMVIAFFVLAGAVFRVPDWVWCGIAMAVAGAIAGGMVHILKFAVGRTRPELWLGAFHHARASASSFPSGHTVGAFALAGILIFHARSTALGVLAAVLAIAVGVSRILAFRHWPSDVVASAALGLLVARAITERVTAVTPGSDADH